MCHIYTAVEVCCLWSGSCLFFCTQEGEDAAGMWWKRGPEQWGSGELLLACGATAVADLRAAVAAELDFSCSAGIAHNKACSAAFCLLLWCVYAPILSWGPHALLSGRVAQRRAVFLALCGPWLRHLGHVEHHLQFPLKQGMAGTDLQALHCG